jgi:hypothetical protein
MMATMTMEQAQDKRRKDIEGNRDLGVVPYRSGQKQSDAVYEVTEGYKHLPGGIRLGPGQRFHPTEKQVASGSLRGKAVEISREAYRTVERQAERPTIAGADIGIRALPMAQSTATYAITEGLTEADFAGVEPEGANGRFLMAQVEAMVAAKRAVQAD